MVPFETRVALAEDIASRARALGFATYIEVRDAYSSQTCRPEQLGKILGQYQSGDNVTLETLVQMGRNKVRVM
jgi:hypothetical protein